MRHWTITICLAIPIAAQQPAIFTIDGKLTEPAWRDQPVQRLAPSQPGPAGGEIRAVVAGRYLYLAAHLPEPSGRFTARLTGRNPNWEQEDALRILAGASIGYTDRIVQVNPLGAYSVEKAVHVRYNNVSVMPYSDEWEREVVYQGAENFLVAAVRGEKEWDVEVAIPLNPLSAPGSDHIYISVERIRAPRPGSPQQRWHWPEHGPAAKVPVISGVKWDAPPPVFRPPAAGNQERPIEVGRGKLPPMSAMWSDAAWRDVAAFRLLRDEPGVHAPRLPTEVKLMHDGQSLAVMARCAEPGEIVARVKENDGPVNEDDNFQVYLATSGSAYTQFAINPAGYLLDNVGFTGGPRLSRAREWNSGARTSVRREGAAWVARIDIPLAAAAQALGEMQIPTVWRILLLRHRPGRDGEPAATSVMPVIESETPLCPARYRRMALVDRAALGLRPAEAEGANPPFETRVLSAAERKQMKLSGMLEQQITGRVRRILETEKHDREQLQSRSDWERFRDPKVKALVDFIGPFPPRTPLHTQVTKEFRARGYRRQDLVYESRPGMWVTANLYLPETPPGRMPGIVIIHSHHRPRTQAELQDMGILWARAGCAVLIMDQIGHGERLQTYPWNREGYHSRYVMGMQLYLVGESLIKWIVWDVMRGVDLLLDRPDVDKDKIILLGAVAAGGDPAAVTAVLDPRIAAVAPFNFGEATPRNGGGNGRWPLDLADPGWGSWESTRNMASSIAGQFLPWVIDAAVAPRRLVYSFEMGWQVESRPAWPRYQKVFGFYSAIDHLAEAHGFGEFPGPGECANIGPAQRRTLYPTLQRWFGVPIPASEPDDRRPEEELASLTPTVSARLGMRTLHDLAREEAVARLQAGRKDVANLAPAARRRWFQEKLAARLGSIEPGTATEATSYWTKSWRSATVEGITLQVEPGIVVPLLLLRPIGARTRTPVVLAVSEGGKEAFFEYRSGEIESLLNSGIAVCLPDVRGTGETAPDYRRGPAATEISLAATELMLGNTLLGARLKDLRTVVAYVGCRPDLDAQRMAIWGDSFTLPNPRQGMLDEAPNFRIGPDIQHQAEPLGGMLAILGGLYEDRLRAIAVHGGLTSFLSILDDAFVYVPEDVVVPGILETGDLADVAATLAPHPLLLEGLVDGRNRLAVEPDLRATFAPVYDSYRGEPHEFDVRMEQKSPHRPDWLAEKLLR